VSKKKSKDPFYLRECEKYDNPIPSREYILQILQDFGRPMSTRQLFQALDMMDDTKHEALSFRLRAMLRDGQLMQDRRGRYCLFARLNLCRGTIQAHPDGFGFCIPEDGSQDLVLSAKEMRSVMHGDVVLVYQVGVDRRGRPEGKVHEIIEHANVRVVGRFFCEHGIGFVVPDSKRLTQDLTIPPDLQLNAQHGQIVLVEVIAYPSKRTQAVGQIIRVLGEHMAPGMEVQVAILAHGLPVDWPADVENMVSKIPQHVTDEDLVGRKDLRTLPFVTIDGEDAKDFDDAVYCVPKKQGGFQLYVAIADVSHYVKPGSPLDKEASRRGNSVYFPGYVLPMLPEVLSNGICSLNPKADRLCMVVEMAITAEGKIQRSSFYRAVIHSQARLTYTQVHDWLSGQQPAPTSEQLWPSLQTLYSLYKILLKQRVSRGAMDFNTTETRIEFDDQKKIQKIVPVIRNDAHRLIEECMLAANVATANFLKKSKLPTLYRVHLAPAEDKVTALRAFLGELGLSLGGGQQPTPKDFQKTLLNIGDRPERHLIETVMLRSLKQAQYVAINQGHFGLAYPAYTHFTSPIRRFPDLLIHRAIGHIIDNNPEIEYEFSEDEMGKLGKHCSSTERRADEATREVVAWLKCEYMQDKLGQVYSGKISAVTGFGIFVELDDIYVEGLVHVTSLKNDYYTFDAGKHRLTGEVSGMSYRLGDAITVLVARVDLDERKIDFVLADETQDD
jgi:ribonuclease R